MNPVFREGVSHIQLAWISGVMTVVFTLVFIGWAWWAFSKKNKQRFEEAAQLPLDTGGDE